MGTLAGSRAASYPRLGQRWDNAFTGAISPIWKPARSMPWSTTRSTLSALGVGGLSLAHLLRLKAHGAQQARSSPHGEENHQPPVGLAWSLPFVEGPRQSVPSAPVQVQLSEEQIAGSAVGRRYPAVGGHFAPIQE